MDSVDLGREVAHADSLCRLGRFEEAIDRLGPVLASEPDHVRATLLLACALIGRRDAPAALEYAERAASLAPDMEWPHRLASIASRHLGRRDDAVRHGEIAVQLGPLRHETHLMLAEALLMPQSRLSREFQADLRRAEAAAHEAVNLAPHDANSHAVVGNALAAAGDEARAEAAYRRALEVDPEHVGALNNLARLGVTYKHRTVLGALQNPGALAAATNGFADALAADPNSRLARRNVDHITRMLLRSLAWLIFIDAVFVARFTHNASSPVVRLVPLLPLALLAVTAARYVRALSPPLRAHLKRILYVERPIRASAGCLALAALALVAECVATADARRTLTAIGALLAIVGYLLLRLHAERRSPRPQGHLLSSRATLAIAIGFAVVGFVGAGVAHRGPPHAAAGTVTAVVGFGIAATLLLNIARRYFTGR